MCGALHVGGLHSARTCHFLVAPDGATAGQSSAVRAIAAVLRDGSQPQYILILGGGPLWVGHRVLHGASSSKAE